MTAHVETDCPCEPKTIDVHGIQTIVHRALVVTGKLKRRKIGGLPEGYIVKGSRSVWTMTRKERDDEIRKNAETDQARARLRRRMP